MNLVLVANPENISCVFKVRNEPERVTADTFAIVTDVHWIRNTMRAFGFLMPGEVRLFPMDDKAAAREWISAK